LLNAATLFLYLVSYSFIGWVYESALCSYLEKRFVNRGFLNGPVCPVYGFGAVLVIAVFGGTRNVALLFFGGMLLTCSLEFLTSLILEKLFHAKWWDYSQYRFNIQGRVCLQGALVFGALSVLIVLFIHPFILKVLSALPDGAVIGLSAVFLAGLCADIVLTVRHLLMLDGRLKEIQEAFNRFAEPYAKRAGELKTTLLEKFEESEYFTERIRRLFSLSRFQDIRLALAFPKLRHFNYNDAWQKLKKFLLNSKEK